MFKAAYTTDFYRAVRDALHAEVDSWHHPSPAENQVAALWRKVEELEPISRDPDPFVFGEEAYLPPPAIVTVEQLLHSGETA